MNSTGLSLGIVGLPNVGKSTLFRALTSVAVPAENYPFCTIEPNVGVVAVPDERLDRLAALVKPERVRPAVVRFVDIAGLVEGASQGEGLGNRFLQNIREVDAVVHVVRCFEDGRVARAGGGGTPEEDLAIVGTELALADLETVARRIDRLERKVRSGEAGAADELALLRRLEDRLGRGSPALREPLSGEERRRLRSFNLLTLKPTLYLANVDAAAMESGDPVPARLREALEAHVPEAEVVPVCAQLEAELLELPVEERRAFLSAHGMERSGLDRLVRAGFRVLGLQTFFTWNDEELRAWTVRRGATAPEAAGRVHSDFERGFIRAEAIHVDDFLALGTMKEARERGRVRSEGREYRVRDGDILLFRASA